MTLKYQHAFEECSYNLPHDGPCRNLLLEGNVNWEDVPVAPWNEIVPRLWVGSSIREDPTDYDFDIVFTMWRGARRPTDVEEVRWEIADMGLPDLDRLAVITQQVRQSLVMRQRVLVRCQAGLNRSSLVAASVLIDMGKTPTEAIDLIRSKRSRWALCNPNFEKYLLSLGD